MVLKCNLSDSDSGSWLTGVTGELLMRSWFYISNNADLCSHCLWFFLVSASCCFVFGHCCCFMHNSPSHRTPSWSTSLCPYLLLCFSHESKQEKKIWKLGISKVRSRGQMWYNFLQFLIMYFVYRHISMVHMYKYYGKIPQKFSNCSISVDYFSSYT